MATVALNSFLPAGENSFADWLFLRLVFLVMLLVALAAVLAPLALVWYLVKYLLSFANFRSTTLRETRFVTAGEFAITGVVLLVLGKLFGNGFLSTSLAYGTYGAFFIAAIAALSAATNRQVTTDGTDYRYPCPSCRRDLKLSEIPASWNSFRCPGCGVWLQVIDDKFGKLVRAAPPGGDSRYNS
jgi:small-conductance mechanosensitive channel